MNTYTHPDRSEWPQICRRPSAPDEQVISRVTEIIEQVRQGGDEALRRLTRELEHRELQESISLSPETISGASNKVSPEVKKAIEQAASNIEAFHRAQLPKAIDLNTMPGVRCIQKPVAIPRIGLYIPGGSAPLFSTVLMLAIPARLAGCEQVILCSPSTAPELLYAAHYCGITQIYSLGGAQAIAAMAIGTESVPKVDKVFGPGNRWVTTAKQLLSTSDVAIDMPAGPSEVMVLADESAEPAFVAADLLSQAEHGPDSQVVLVCTSEELANTVYQSVREQLMSLPRQEIAAKALERSSLVVLQDESQMVDFANTYAPEHLIISTIEPWRIAERITSAGSVFVGHFSPESAGDYASGTNHTLPTCGWARAYSGVNVESFMRRMTIQELTKDGLQSLSNTIIKMAEAEGLQAHAGAVRVRL